MNSETGLPLPSLVLGLKAHITPACFLFCLMVIYCKTGFPFAAQAGLELPKYTKLALNLEQFSCFCFQRAGVADVCPHLLPLWDCRVSKPPPGCPLLVPESEFLVSLLEPLSSTQALIFLPFSCAEQCALLSPAPGFLPERAAPGPGAAGRLTEPYPRRPLHHPHSKL
jgi:hypothetical protein